MRKLIRYVAGMILLSSVKKYLSYHDETGIVAKIVMLEIVQGLSKACHDKPPLSEEILSARHD